MRIRLLATLLAVFLASCTVGPDYQRPTVASPDAWRIDYPKAIDVANTKWWEQFGDPVLNELVETALRENLDIQIAAARVDQFIGALTSTRSQLFPQIGYGADASRVRASAVGQPPLPPGADPYFSLYQGSLGASWQLDLFGRVRRLTEAAQAQVYASEQAQHGGFAVLDRQGGHAHVDGALLQADDEAAILGQALFGDIQFRHQLQALDQGRADLAVRLGGHGQDAIDAETDL